MDPLTELAIKYGTDKWGKHHYTPVYHRLFRGSRHLFEGVLEIGVAEGAGLRMLKDYFTNAHIYGADNDFYRIFKEERITVFECDQSSKEDLEKLMEKIPVLDLVIDDGSHEPMHQVITCLKLMSLLNVDVTYVIEDVSDLSIVKYFYNYNVEIVKCSDRYDDNLVIVRHK